MEWTCERVGANPQLPSSNTSNGNEVLLHGSVSPVSPLMRPDGGRVYRVWIPARLPKSAAARRDSVRAPSSRPKSRRAMSP